MKHARKAIPTIATAVVIAILGMLLFAPSATSAPSSRTTASVAHRFQGIPVTGTTGSGAPFLGTMQITRFAPSGGTVNAVGTISGVAKNATGAVVRTVLNAPAQLPISAASATCKILHLVLGPLTLDLLGLHVHLNKVVLDITATRGPGELLGNLLCALAHLLDGGQPSVISNLLTAVQRIVSGLGFLA